MGAIFEGAIHKALQYIEVIVAGSKIVAPPPPKNKVTVVKEFGCLKSNFFFKKNAAL